jgi:membrane fusion protein (multidrug efflux system)
MEPAMIRTKESEVVSAVLKPALWVLALTVGFGLLASGCANKDSAGEESPESNEVTRNVRILEIERGDLTEFLDIAGVLSPVRGTDISTEEGGTVASLSAEKGAVVGKGGTVILLDRGLLKAQMESAEAARALREFNEERTRELFDSNNVSRQEMLQVQTQHEQAKADAEMARIRYERAAIRAPFEGIITDRFVELGELVQPGTRVVRIVDPFTLKLVGSMTERDVRWIEKDSPVQITVEGVDGAVAGSVHWVGFEADPRTGKFPVEIWVENPDLLIRPGVLGRARIEKTSHENVIAIPRDAVVQRPGEQVVFLEVDGRSHERSVRLGSDQGNLVVALDGLQEGDHLIVRGQRDLVDNGRVIVQEIADARDGTLSTDPEELREYRKAEETQDLEKREQLQ